MLLRTVYAILLLSAVVSCRKTATDPLLSLRSREARVEGTWQVISYTKKTTTSYPDTAIILDEKLSGNNITNQYTGDTCTYTYDVQKWVYEFDKNGNYRIERKLMPGIVCKSTYAGDSVIIETTLGTWNLTGGAHDTKKKTQLLLSPTSYTSEFGRYNPSPLNVTEPNSGSVYNIVTLKNKSMTLSYKTSTTPYGQNYTIAEDILVDLVQR